MGNKLYVGNLSYSVTSDSLNDLFSQFGTVLSAKVIEDRETGRSKGFSFVEMANASEAEMCIQKLNGYNLADRQLNVSEAKPQEKRSDRGGYDRGGRPGGQGGGFRSGRYN